MHGMHSFRVYSERIPDWNGCQETKLPWGGVQLPCSRTASAYSAPIPSPESSSGISRYRFAGLRLHAHMDQAGKGQDAEHRHQGLPLQP
jgi:hypothetical protein